MSVFEPVLQRCEREAPVGVMARLALGRALSPEWLDSLFEAEAERVFREALAPLADDPDLDVEHDAELLAKELGVPVRYTWYPDSMGFIRNTLRARICDIVIGTISNNELLQNTVDHAFPKEREYFVGLRLLADTGEDDDTE